MSTTQMRAEIAEQQSVIAKLLSRRQEIDSLILSPFQSNKIKPVGCVTFARGSSANANMFLNYLLEITAHIPTFVGQMDQWSLYNEMANYEGWVAVATSQSGETPEIVGIAQAVKKSGAFTIGISNDPQSALAKSCDASINLDAGKELAVPATKTMTAQIAAQLFIADSFAPEALDWELLNRLPELIGMVLDDEQSVKELAQQFDSAPIITALGRGLFFPAASEIALKYRETTSQQSESFILPEFRHGPISSVSKDSLILFVDRGYEEDEDTNAVFNIAKNANAKVFRIGKDCDLSLPAFTSNSDVTSDFVIALLAIIRGQQFVAEICDRFELNADNPANLSKVTLTYL